MACDGSTILVEKTNFQALNNVAKVSVKLQPVFISQNELRKQILERNKARKRQFLLIYSTMYAGVGGWVGLKKAKNMLTLYLNGPIAKIILTFGR